MQDLPSTCRLGIHPVNLQWCNSNLVPDLSALLSDQETEAICEATTHSICYSNITRSLLPHNTADGAGNRCGLWQLSDRQSVLWVHLRSTLSRSITTRRGEQTSALWLTTRTIQHVYECVRMYWNKRWSWNIENNQIHWIDCHYIFHWFFFKWKALHIQCKYTYLYPAYSLK